jgi:hypothetical protein
MMVLSSALICRAIFPIKKHGYDTGQKENFKLIIQA